RELQARVRQLEEEREQEREEHRGEIEEANDLHTTHRSMIRRLRAEVADVTGRMLEETRRRRQAEANMVRTERAAADTVADAERYSLIRVEEERRRGKKKLAGVKRRMQEEIDRLRADLAVERQLTSELREQRRDAER